MFVSSQVVTTLKDTSKPVTDVPFPALTLCGTGVHLNNMEKKLILDFEKWRAKENRNDTTKEAIKKDIEDFMQIRFQIKPSQEKRENPVNILDILEAMVTPDVEVSLAVNSIRENTIACKQHVKLDEVDNSECTYTCSDDNFKLQGSKCFYLSSNKVNYDGAVAACRRMNAELATITNAAEDSNVYEMMLEKGMTTNTAVLIGLTNININNKNLPCCTWVWQDGTLLRSYNNWALFPDTGIQEPTGNDGNCVGKSTYHGGKGGWADFYSYRPKYFAWSMAAQESCDT